MQQRYFCHQISFFSRGNTLVWSKPWSIKQTLGSKLKRHSIHSSNNDSNDKFFKATLGVQGSDYRGISWSSRRREKTWKLDFNHDNEPFENWNFSLCCVRIPKTIEVEQSKNCCNTTCQRPISSQVIAIFPDDCHHAYCILPIWKLNGSKSSSFNGIFFHSSKEGKSAKMFLFMTGVFYGRVVTIKTAVNIHVLLSLLKGPYSLLCVS